jgi:ornithine carrier protein
MEVHKSLVSGVVGGSGLSKPVLEVYNEIAEHSSRQGEEAIKDIVCGSVAGAIRKCIEHPFDTVKVRLQSQLDTGPLRYTGPLDCFKKMVQRDRWIIVYRGISAPMLGAVVETSTLFFSVSTEAIV